MSEHDPKELKKALLSMGYRECQPGAWLKPVGWQSFGFSEKKNEWSNWFLDAQGKISLWEAKILLLENEPLESIKDWENDTRTDLCYGGARSQFELGLPREMEIKLLLGGE